MIYTYTSSPILFCGYVMVECTEVSSALCITCQVTETNDVGSIPKALYVYNTCMHICMYYQGCDKRIFSSECVIFS